MALVLCGLFFMMAKSYCGVRVSCELFGSSLSSKCIPKVGCV